jgi:O-antigen/teichoic acid export membrane protein
MSLLTKISLHYDARKESIKTHRRTIKSIGALAGGNLAGSLLGAAGGILVARFIGPEVNGQFRLFTIPLMYLNFLHLGTFDGLYRQIPFYIGSDRPDHVKKIASATGAWNLFATIVVASGFLLFAVRGLSQGNLMDAVGWLSQALTCAGIFYGGYLAATYRTLDNFVVLARIQLIEAMLAFGLVFTVALWGFYGLCLRAAIPALLGVWLYHRARPLRVPLIFDLSALKEVVKIGMPLCFWGTLYYSIWVAAEYTLMYQFGGVRGVGLFSVAAVMGQSISILPLSVHQVFMPRVVESYARQGGVREATRRSFQAAGVLTLLMVIVVLIVSVLLDYFVPLFIPKYIDGLLLMKVCLGLAVIYAASLPLNGLVATGRSWLYGKGILSGLLAFPLAVYLLNPLIGGMMAVAVGSLIGRLVRTVVAYFDLIMLMRRENSQL